MLNRFPEKNRGFTLVETALALLVIGLAFLSILGLGRSGMQSPGATVAYILDWTLGAVVATTIDSKYMEADISRDGNYLAFITTSNVVGYIIMGEVTENIIGSGSYMSWTNDNKIGYLDYAGGYTLYDVNTQTSKNYSVASGTFLQCAVVNWDGTKIAFRTFGGGNTGISVGVLNN